MSQKDLYLAELILNLNRFVEVSVSTDPITYTRTLPTDCILTQHIIGDYQAFTAIYGDADALCQFAIKYSKFEITSFDDITKEVLADFLNLHNGLFTVNLSNSKAIECSLLPPCLSDIELPKEIETFYVMPVLFDFGTVNFVLAEN